MRTLPLSALLVNVAVVLYFLFNEPEPTPQGPLEYAVFGATAEPEWIFLLPLTMRLWKIRQNMIPVALVVGNNFSSAASSPGAIGAIRGSCTIPEINLSSSGLEVASAGKSSEAAGLGVDWIARVTGTTGLQKVFDRVTLRPG